MRLAGLPGSSGAALAAWLARESPQRMLVVVATTPADAERWLSDLALLTDAPAALYPQREALGEDEPHYEIAGERAETIEALLSGRLRVLVTTARATSERTLVPAALERLRVRLNVGLEVPPATLASRLDAMGYTRVPTVTEVAEYSVRGGILDVYGFGMAAPARLEWWGDEISSLRSFDLTTQRSGPEMADVSVLPIKTSGGRTGDTDKTGETGGTGGTGSSTATTSPVLPVQPVSPVSPVSPVRQTLLDLLPPDALLFEESSSADADEVSRAWN